VAGRISTGVRNRVLRSSRAATAVAALVLAGAACSPVYVVKAGLAQIQILGNRRPLPEVVLDPATDPVTRGTLTLVMEARDFARDQLDLEVGGSYTSYSELPSDTLAMVLSAAYRDRLQARTWWFPIVGHVPYRGFFDLDEALAEQRSLEADGFDTYLRPTSAFSTLGWFDDPLLSSVLQADDVEVVTTVIHELSHTHLFIPGQVGFNESYATFVGRAGAAEFFCTRPGGGPDTVKCLRAQARWRDAQRFSRFLETVVRQLEAVYGDPESTAADKVRRRGTVFDDARRRFDREIAPELESLTFGSFLSLPLNNATLLSRIRYYRSLSEFEALRAEHGGLRDAVRHLKENGRRGEDAFRLLPR
jgi:predicted aminopeptidase